MESIWAIVLDFCDFFICDICVKICVNLREAFWSFLIHVRPFYLFFDKHSRKIKYNADTMHYA